MGTSTERRSLIGFSSIFGRLFHATTNPARYDVDGTRCSFGSATLLAIIVRDAPVLRLDAVQAILRRLVAKAACVPTIREWALPAIKSPLGGFGQSRSRKAPKFLREPEPFKRLLKGRRRCCRQSSKPDGNAHIVGRPRAGRRKVKSPETAARPSSRQSRANNV